MTRSLEDQLRSLADRSVGSVGPDSMSPPVEVALELEAFPPTPTPGRARLARPLLAAAAVLVVLGTLAALAIWRDTDPGPVVTTPATTPETTVVACPDSVSRRSERSQPGTADGLPFLDDSVTDRAVAEQVLEDEEASIRQRHPAATSLTVGPGFGWAWSGERGNDRIVPVDDFGIEVELPALGDCPRGTDLSTTATGPFPGVPLFFGYRVDSTAVPPPTTIASGQEPAGWQLRDQVLDPSSTSFVASVTRNQCAGGRTGDVSRPMIEYGETEVVVIFRPPDLPDAFYTCPSNAPTRVQVELEEPLGDRVLIDGGCLADGRLPPNLCERWRPEG